MTNRKIVLIVAPHADDETLGCGGTILRNLESGAEVHWLLITKMCESYGYSQIQVQKRKDEIELVSNTYGFSGVHQLNFQPASLDTIPKSELINSLSAVINEVKPEVVYTVYRNDAHSDHEVVYDVECR